MKNKKCQCWSCTKLSPVLKKLKKKLTKLEWNVIMELYNKWECSETDSAYWESKFKGTWPK